ncbi:hypothetical protein I302_108666 [Kwoniella bestiolae CBS 10118]|uniref:Uncharacterized protein n=1 Tax=Kwoniella bestiolae CBS 10118 TaxID=1296100 RepID=A0A1B9FTQ0_9TREE|nr:hypothetical protein I302_07801 [Kwoniella bestiolae CBS 10118]OCF22157.1 hypothetical protein I302_07801 [Kwoniella bestiolae CBS 10118]
MDTQENEHFFPPDDTEVSEHSNSVIPSSCMETQALYRKIAELETQRDAAINLLGNYPHCQARLIDGLTRKTSLLDIQRTCASTSRGGSVPESKCQEVSHRLHGYYAVDVGEAVKPQLRSLMKDTILMNEPVEKVLEDATMNYGVEDLSIDTRETGRRYRLWFGESCSPSGERSVVLDGFSVDREMILEDSSRVE